MIHVVFQHADVEALKKSFELDEALQGQIFEIQDDYAVGPLNDLFSDEGMAARLQWWKEILTDGHYEGIADDGHVNDPAVVTEIKKLLDEISEETLWIWAAQNKHDVSGYYWLMSQLKDYQGRVLILYLNNLPFINEKGNLFYPTNLFQIPAKEFLKAKKLARPITLSEFEVDPDEWTKLANENKGVRLLEGGKKLIQKEYDYYDAELLKFVTKDWQKVHKFFNQFYSKANETTGDAYLLWRLKNLAASGTIDVQGNKKNMKEMEIRWSVPEPINLLVD
ncbi:MAG: DUF1835 domain-containing protein [Chitinophagaceae bacterium]|nr:DUF1835 domain-containing protein [Chitinophagaceae bacterium]